MPRVPSSARRPKEDEEEKPSGRKRVTLADHLLSSVQLPQLGRPPRDDEEKRAVLRALVYLKSSGKTNAESAQLLEVSERTINNYMAEEGYIEMQREMQADARERGFTTITTLIDDALSELYSIMKTDKSGFVRFKSAETLLNFAGYNMPREESKKDSREEVMRFLGELAHRQQSGVQVNVQVNQVENSSTHTDQGMVIEAETREIPAELEQYYTQVLPGGKMPYGTRDHTL